MICCRLIHYLATLETNAVAAVGGDVEKYIDIHASFIDRFLKKTKTKKRIYIPKKLRYVLVLKWGLKRGGLGVEMGGFGAEVVTLGAQMGVGLEAEICGFRGWIWVLNWGLKWVPFSSGAETEAGIDVFGCLNKGRNGLKLGICGLPARTWSRQMDVDGL
nr:hypothetical protein [Tanacetum cinerariifolium]